MNDNLDKTLADIGRDYRPEIAGGSRFYLEVDIGRHAERLGFPDIGEKYRNIHAIVPLKQPAGGMKVRVDGRTFVGHVQFESGVVVPGYVARDSGLPRTAFTPNDSMICNFT